MGPSTLGQRIDYASGDPAYNDFLFALIDKQSVDVEYTVLSTLARNGIEPWHEAVRLAGLSPADAALSLATSILGLPDIRWTAAQAATAAQRLVAALPR